MLCIFAFSGVYAQSPVYPVRDGAMNLGSGNADVYWFPYTPVKKVGGVFEMYYTWDGLLCYATSPTGKGWTFKNFVTCPSNESIIKKNNTWYMGYHKRVLGKTYFHTTSSSNGLTFPSGVSRFEAGEDMSFLVVNDSFYCYIRPDIPNVDPLRKIGLMKSADFVNWSEITPIMWIDSADYENPASPDFRKQFYSMSVFRVGADWWALANVYRIGNLGQDVEHLPPYSGEEHTVDVQLLYSTDGMNWQRTNNRGNFLQRAPGVMQVYGSPTLDGNKLYIYTIESERRHTDFENAYINGRFFDIWRYQINTSDLESWKPLSTISIKMGVQGLMNAGQRLNKKEEVKLSVRSSQFPFNIIDSATAKIDSLTLTANFRVPPIPTGSYYFVINGKNIFETWTKNPVQVMESQNVSYDFTTNASKAFGDNLINVNDRYCIYSGDVDQNLTLDLRDLTAVFNCSQGSLENRAQSDINGDGQIGLEDIIMVYNNFERFVHAVRP